MYDCMYALYTHTEICTHPCILYRDNENHAFVIDEHCIAIQWHTCFSSSSLCLFLVLCLYLSFLVSASICSPSLNISLALSVSIFMYIYIALDFSLLVSISASRRRVPLYLSSEHLVMMRR